MENMTIEELTAVFGSEVAAEMFAQMNQAGGGTGAPFSFIKKISDMDSELGAWGEHVVGVKTEKAEDGSRTIIDKGTNLGKEFEVIIVNVGYQYSRWDDIKERTESSNAFTDLSAGIKSAVNRNTGEPLPADKQAKKDAGWKMNKVMGVLVRPNTKADWVQAIYEVNGVTYFTLGELTGGRPNKGLLDGLYTLKYKTEKKGATSFMVIDTEKSVCSPLPKDLFTNEVTKDMVAEITTKMIEYRAGQQHASSAQTATPSTDKEVDEW